MNTHPAVVAIVARLDLIPDLDAYDGVPPGTPLRRYVCVWDQTGTQYRHKYAGLPGRVLLPFQVSVVGRTREGAREAAGWVREQLALWVPVPGATPIVEEYGAPILTDGPPNDVRYTMPILYHTHLPKEL